MNAPTRERLYQLVDQIPDDKLMDAVALLEDRLVRADLPGFVGIMHSGGLSERVKEIYREGMANDRR